MKYVLGILILFAVIIGSLFLSVGGFVCNYARKAGQVVQEEIDPRKLFDRYMWFKDAAAQLDAKVADIKAYQDNLTSMKADYAGIARHKWDRTDKEQFNQWQLEVKGMIASFNDLAAEYNAQMAKINWKFCNIGSLPKGATEPLPREFKPYRIQ